MEIVERLVEIRTECKLSQNQLAKQLDVSRSSICEIEAGKYPVKKVYALALQALLGINANWLLTGLGPKYTGLESKMVVGE